MTMADGDSIYVETTPSVPLYAQMMMTKKMVDIEGAHDSLMEITFSKYTAGRPAIYISAVDARPDALHRQYALIEGTTPSLLNGSLPSFGITIDLKTVRWPDGNAPFGRHEGNDSALLDDDVAIDGWTGLLYLGIDCVEGDSVALDVEAKFMAKEAVSRISYGVPAYSQIEAVGECKYFTLDLGDSALSIDLESNRHRTGRRLLALSLALSLGLRASLKCHCR